MPANFNFQLGASGAKVSVASQPLFASIGRGSVLAAGSQSSSWQLVTFETEKDEVSPWDTCHALISDGFGLTAHRVEFVEPDLLQRWQAGPQISPLIGFGVAGGAKQNKDYPTLENNFWFR